MCRHSRRGWRAPSGSRRRPSSAARRGSSSAPGSRDPVSTGSKVEEEAWLDRRRSEHGDAGHAIVVLEAMRDALAATARRVDDERRCVEASGDAAHGLLDVARRLQRGAQRMRISRSMRLSSARLPSPLRKAASTLILSFATPPLTSDGSRSWRGTRRACHARRLCVIASAHRPRVHLGSHRRG